MLLIACCNKNVVPSFLLVSWHLLFHMPLESWWNLYHSFKEWLLLNQILQEL